MWCPIKFAKPTHTSQLISCPSLFVLSLSHSDYSPAFMAPVHVPFPSPPSFHFNHLPSHSLSFLSSSHFLFHSTTFHPPDSFFYSPIRSRPFTPVIFLSHAFSHFAPFCNSSSETRQPMRTKSVLSKPGPPTDWTNRPENSPLNPPQQKKNVPAPQLHYCMQSVRNVRRRLSHYGFDVAPLWSLSPPVLSSLFCLFLWVSHLFSFIFTGFLSHRKKTETNTYWEKYDQDFAGGASHTCECASRDYQKREKANYRVILMQSCRVHDDTIPPSQRDLHILRTTTQTRKSNDWPVIEWLCQVLLV